MAVIIDRNTRAIVQGITGSQGQFHTGQMLAFGTNIVGGVNFKKAGQQVQGVPVFATVHEAVEKTGANASVMFVPAPGVKDAAFEAIHAGIKVLVLIPEHVPTQETMEIMAYAKRHGVRVIGPNTFGIISPGEKCKLGIMPNHIYKPGPVGIVARSGTLSYEIAFNLSNAGLGQTTVIGMGGDRVIGTNFVDALELFNADPATEAIVMVGEIGGIQEELAAEYIKQHVRKPVVAYLAGKSAPPGKRMGHAGAIIEGNRGTYQSKVEALTAAGVKVAALPWEIVDLVREALK
ncbi:succinate--CoA ligase subunit alpha [Symbiobacterium thermophilum]|uniref:Succinate--CoA ligase [ADP-forming] subunit alpha n=1 Tax=Symbiobacterium thermophilum (strain DSM 24528 / JCM 14929 / IAM 14863 / T) TaxID=292459 RepID=Q67LC9_SYMTH|nr:succinate--CoA ligase subunit alpha [Symbiobacterium thermophilum]BAD41517.1 succinyl-CoA synthetase alpha subunit [Symbiobacterium thermophilum IAM 14863]